MTINNNNILEIQNYPEYSVIRFSGFVDAATIEHIKNIVNTKLPEQCRQIIIDLEKTEFLDSHGVGFFVSLLKKVHSHKGRLIFSGAIDQPASVLNMVGFNGSLVTYCDNIQKAVASLDKVKAG